ncbi:MAG: putative replication initiation protein [Bacteriophage sp.]|nr:MAG: putative replication initiation protein [Bacteriophage sp.]
MGCNNPKKAWHIPGDITPRGKPKLRFAYPGTEADEILLPCNRCTGCYMNIGQDWMTRLINESAMHEWSWFLTLTYDEENLPYGNSLVPEHSHKFARALRDHFRRRGEKIRHYMIGEYGGRFGRPHYHGIVFGPEFSDRKKVATRNGEHTCFESPLIAKLWGKGIHELSLASPDTMAYVSKYVTKKALTREDPFAHHYVVPETGEMIPQEPEFAHMSRRPGIGAKWLDKWTGDVFPSDEIVANGKAMRVPRYYYNRLKERDPELAERVRASRKKKALAVPLIETTTRRRKVKETIAERKALGGTNIGSGRYRNAPGMTGAELQKKAKL